MEADFSHFPEGSTGPVPVLPEFPLSLRAEKSLLKERRKMGRKDVKRKRKLNVNFQKRDLTLNHLFISQLEQKC